MEDYRSLVVSSARKADDREKADATVQVNKADQRKAAADRRAKVSLR